MSSISAPNFSSEPYIEAIGYKQNVLPGSKARPELFFPSLKIALHEVGFEHADSPRNIVFQIFCTSVSQTTSFQVNQLTLKEIFEEREAAKKTICSDPTRWKNVSDKLTTFLFSFIPDDGLFEEVSRTEVPSKH